MVLCMQASSQPGEWEGKVIAKLHFLRSHIKFNIFAGGPQIGDPSVFLLKCVFLFWVMTDERVL